MLPGETELTRTPYGASSTASAFVKAVIAPLVAKYVAACRWPMVATRLDILMMLPFVRRRYGSANFEAGKMLTRLSSRRSRNSATENSSIDLCGGCQPALLIKQSILS